MVKQNNGKVYKVQDIGGNKCFIDATNKQYLSQRMDKHRSDYKTWLAGEGTVGKMCIFEIFEEYGVENCVIVLIENFSCDNHEELKARRIYHITNTECVNKRIRKQVRTTEQKEKDKVTQKEYRVKNKDMIADRQREYIKNNYDDVAECKHNYFIENREKLNAKKAIYYARKDEEWRQQCRLRKLEREQAQATPPEPSLEESIDV